MSAISWGRAADRFMSSSVASEIMRAVWPGADSRTSAAANSRSKSKGSVMKMSSGSRGRGRSKPQDFHVFSRRHCSRSRGSANSAAEMGMTGL